MNVGSFIIGMGLGCLANYLSLVGETGNLNIVDKLGHTLVITAISLGIATKTYFDAPVLEKVYEQQILKNVPLTGIGVYTGLELMNYLII